MAGVGPSVLLYSGIAVLVVGLVAIGVSMFLFWLFMLIDAIKRDFAKEDEKIVWAIVIVLLGILGATIYYYVVKRPASRSK